jgi:hypothetical protein
VKRVTLIVGLLVAFVLLGAMSAPIASAQPLDTPLDGVWLKCKANVKGYIFDPSAGDYFRQNGTLPFYLYFVWDNDNSWYDVFVYTYVDGDWTHTVTSEVTTSQPGGNFISNLYLQFLVGITDYIETHHTPFITYKYKDGKLSKVTYKGTGEVDRGYFNGGTLNYYGYFNVSGTMVDESKVPFPH